MSKRAVLLGVVTWSALACGFDASPTGHSVCVEGQSAECACENGARGLHTCSDGEYGACSCGSASGVSPGDPTSGGDDEGSTSSGGAGSGSSAGSDPGGSGTAGAGSVPGSTPTAGGGSQAGSGAAVSGTGGTSGDAGKGGSGEAGSSTGEAGSSGSDGGSGGDDEVLPPAEPGTPYGACAAQGDCEGGLLCYTLNANGDMTGYCAPPCTFDGSGNGSGGLGRCKQQPESGEVQAQCATLLGVCLLATCEGQSCPSGMECVETALGLPQQSGLYDCRYPASP